MFTDVPRAHFDAKAQRPVVVRFPVVDQFKNDAGHFGLLNRAGYGTRDAASNCERDWQTRLKQWEYKLVQSSHKNQNIWYDAWRRLRGHRDNSQAHRLNKLAGVCPIQTKIIRLGSAESIKAMNRRVRWGEREV